MSDQGIEFSPNFTELRFINISLTNNVWDRIIIDELDITICHIHITINLFSFSFAESLIKFLILKSIESD